MSQLRWSSGACTHVGNVRERNEDTILERPDIGIWAVADGMGGHDRGDYASKLAIESLPVTPPPATIGERLREISGAVQSVNMRLIEDAEGKDLCGTTLVLMTVVNGLMACMWIGDSRAYIWRNSTLEPVTRDHTELQELMDSGDIDSDLPGHGHVLTRAIGSEPDLEIDLKRIELLDGDKILLCSDGLYDELDHASIANIVGFTESPLRTARRLVDQALQGDCPDNVSVVAVHFEDWD